MVWSWSRLESAAFAGVGFRVDEYVFGGVGVAVDKVWPTPTQTDVSGYLSKFETVALVHEIFVTFKSARFRFSQVLTF